MIGKRMVTALVALGMVVLVAGCSQAATPAPFGGNGALFVGNSTLEAAGLATFAAPQVGGTQQAGIWVGGSGRVVVTPDLVLLTLGVEARADTVELARSQAATAMAAIIAVLTGSGIQEQDIRTQYFSIQPEYVWDDVARRQEIVGYRVSNTVSVKVRDLEGVGTLIDDVASAGGDLVRINNISFTIENPEQYAAQAREAAVQDAMAKAQQFAQLTGVTLDRLVYIAESSASVPMARQFDGPSLAFAEAKAAPPTPISGGEVDIIIRIQAVFSIA